MYDQPSLGNLNYATIYNADDPTLPISQHVHRLAPTVIPSARVTVVFDNLEGHLCRLISRYRVVVGCVAWLTNYNVLDALRGREVGLIVQKEDWLRPDANSIGDWKMQLRGRYGCLTGIENKYAFSHGYNYCGDPEYDAVRCAGILNQGGQKTATPRMHNKFFVMGHYHEVEVDREFGAAHIQQTFVPEVVWTGSYNPTLNGSRSLENAVIIHDPNAARVYADEWGTILGFSEPLDWNATWVSSEMRFGS